MHPVRSTLSTTTNPLVLVALTWALLWGYGATQVPLSLDPPVSHAEQASEAARGYGAEAVWEESWSERHPGCVALALWPADEQPTALLARDGGDVTRIPTAGAPAGGEVVGACR